MFFFLKKPKIKIDCFVPEKYAFAVSYSPIQKASRFLPTWFKNLPNSNEKQYAKNPSKGIQTNVKGCPGIVDTLFNGFVVPLWCDLIIEWSEKNYKYCFSDEFSSLSHHENDQAQSFVDNYWILKFLSPWMLKFNKPVSTFYMPLTYYYGFDHPMKTLFGYNSVWARTNAMFTNQFLLFDKTKPGNLFLKHNSPINHIQIPLEYEVDLKCHVDDNEHKKLYETTAPRISFYKTFMKTRVLDRKKNEV